MAISNDIAIITIGIIFSYLVIYRNNKIYGNVMFICCGLALMVFSTNTIPSAVGLMILLGSLINLVIDLLHKEQRNGRNK